MPAKGGTTLAAVPDPAREARRHQARALRARGLTWQAIADQLGVTKNVVQDDLRPVPKPSPLSVRLPDDLDTDLREAAAVEGISTSQAVARAVRYWLRHRQLEDAKNARKRARRRGGAGPKSDA